MSTRHHVRALCDRLAPAPLEPLLSWTVLPHPSPAAETLEATLEGVRIGGGAAAMHARTHWGAPTTPLDGLLDHESLLLVGLSLRAAQQAAGGAACPEPDQAAAALATLLAREPDFFDELLLELSRRHHVQPTFAALLQGHAAALRGAARVLQDRDAHLHPETGRGLLAGVRRLLGREVAGASPWRHLRLLTGLALLEEKAPRSDPSG